MYHEYMLQVQEQSDGGTGPSGERSRGRGVQELSGLLPRRDQPRKPGGVLPREGSAGSGGNVGDQGAGDHGQTVSPMYQHCDRCSRVTLEELKHRKFDGFLRRICPTCNDVYDAALRYCGQEIDGLKELLRKIRPAIMELSEADDQDCEVQGRLDQARELLKNFE